MRRSRCETCACFRGIQAVGDTTVVRCIDFEKGYDRLVPLYNNCSSHRSQARSMPDTPQREVDDPMREAITREARDARRKKAAKGL